MNYKISKEAAINLEGIWIYTFENWSANQADRYLNLLLNENDYLAENPNSGKKNEELLIIRILHKRMDIESLIKK